MNYKYVSSLFGFLLLAIGYLSGTHFLGNVRAQGAPERVPFTAKMRLVADPGTPQERIAGDRIVGIRSDGTEIFSESLKGRPAQDRVVRVTHPDGRVVVGVGPVTGKSSWFMDARAMRARQEMRRQMRENSCLSSPGQTITGHDVFHGLPVFVIETSPERRNNIVIHAKSWMVPALDCFSIQSRIEIRDANDNVLGVSLRETVSFEPGEPGDSLFGNVAAAEEKRPSQLQRDYLGLLGGPKCADCDQRGEELDLFYEMRQTR
jgi:hypothetical protein